MNRLGKRELQRLQQILKSMGSVLIAYSGGVDSTFLLKIAKETLGEDILAVTAKSPIFPEREYNQAREITRKLKIKHLTILTRQLADSRFVANPTNRCYYCKKELFTKLKQLAKDRGINYVIDGTNYDDTGDFRPGMKAIKELKVRSPLKEAGLTKAEIRLLSRELNLPTWDKPAQTCLASRFPYGDKITLQKLRMVARAEDYLHNLGVKQVRVRHHAYPGHFKSAECPRNNIARIEVSPEDIIRLASLNLRGKIVKRLKDIGYGYVSLDLQGYRPGSLNPGRNQKRHGGHGYKQCKINNGQLTINNEQPNNYQF